MKNQRLWLTVAALLAAIWGGVAVVMHLTDDYVSWPEKVMDLMTETPWLNGKSGQARQPYIDEVIANINRLDFQQNRRLREDGQELLNRFFDSLTPEEQKDYVNRTLERHFETISRGLKLMAPEERKRLVGRMRTDMRAFRGNAKEEDRLSKQDQEFLDVMIEEDPILFLRELPTKTKMEIAPVIEGMVSRLQGPGRR
ncbi:MAG TPA: hypothetical protein VD994_08770 [Prosthecobacter sp.]|nr:hypothetical protein [Prosthecobacter sp.]